MGLPRYCLIGARPVKTIRTEDGGIDVLAYNWETGEIMHDRILGDQGKRAVVGCISASSTRNASAKRIGRILDLIWIDDSNSVLAISLSR